MDSWLGDPIDQDRTPRRGREKLSNTVRRITNASNLASMRVNALRRLLCDRSLPRHPSKPSPVGASDSERGEVMCHIVVPFLDH